MSVEKAIERAAVLFERSHSVLVVTGAGLSADSGLPTYWGIGGLYEDAALEEGVSIELALSGQMLHVDPALTWKYLAQIEAACRGARFNRGHAILAEMERHVERVCVLTQNVDGFHRAAGSSNVIDIHGDIHDLYCTHCGARERVADFAALQFPPSCKLCRGLVRPDVVLFGERLPWQKVRRLDEELHDGFDLVVSIGTRSAFPYIAQPVLDAWRHGIPTVEINPGLTEVSQHVELRLPLRAAEALDRIWAAWHGRG